MAKSKPKRLLMLALLLLTTAATWAAATKQFPLYSGDEGTEAKPYQIKTVEDLIKLSDDVNSGTTYSGEYFKVMNNIDFNDAVDASLRPTTTWDDATSTESNFSGIGSRHGSTIRKFQGHFDGNDNTISGIRIYNAGTTANNGGYQALFGYIGSGAEVKAITLTNTRITGHSFCGGIAGRNEANTTISNCHVTNTVAIHTVENDVDYHGGLIGFNYSGTVTECVSAATLTIAGTNYIGCECYGGIVGFNNGTLTDNFANGVTVAAASNENKHGAIAGDGYATSMQRNYYFDCNVAGVVNAADVGMKGADVTANAASVGLHMLTLAEGITTTTAPTVTFGAIGCYAHGTTITLSGTQTGTPPVGYIFIDGYAVNGEAISGNTFTMPAQNTEVTCTMPVYPLMLADGITTTTTPATTVDATPYYLAGTTITLSGGLPAVTSLFQYASYIVNGEEISGYTFTMPAEAVTVGAAILVDKWQGEGTESSPYLIQNCKDLRMLAYGVNTGAEDTDGKTYGNNAKWYKLVADLQFDDAGLGDDESNFEAIGKITTNRFRGHFLGNGHTISGIRIRQGSERTQGLFGYIADAVISGIILTDADITGFERTGGIVGYNSGTVTDCHVTNSVTIRATVDKTNDHGGIVGYNTGTVSGCTSRATLTIENGATECMKFGGIAGDNDGTLSDNLAFGVHVPNIKRSGAVCGDRSGTLLRNYYHYPESDGYEVRGCNDKDVSDNDGGVPGIAIYNNTVYSDINSYVIQEAASWPRCVALLGRTLYKDGDWNTLCLPFDIGNFEGTILEGATVKELDSSTSSLDDNGVLTLNFNTVTSIEPGKPYIVKWESGSDIENPVFKKVDINSSASTVVDFNGGSFVGTYNPFEITDANRNDILLLAAGNKLGYAKTDRTIANGKALGACRAYFHIPANGGSPAVRQYELDFGEETTGIEPPTFSPEGESTEASPRGGLVGASCFDLQGRRVLPLKKGIYIVNGRKVVIK